MLQVGLFGQGKASQESRGCCLLSITAHPGKTMNGNDSSTICILFSVHQQNIIKTSQPEPIRTALTYETIPRSAWSPFLCTATGL